MIMLLELVKDSEDNTTSVIYPGLIRMEFLSFFDKLLSVKHRPNILNTFFNNKNYLCSRPVIRQPNYV